MFNRDWMPMNATKKTETRDALLWRSRLVRVVPNAPNLGLSLISLLFFYEPNA
jgi:hypothetical protein